MPPLHVRRKGPVPVPVAGTVGPVGTQKGPPVRTSDSGVGRDVSGTLREMNLSETTYDRTRPSPVNPSPRVGSLSTCSLC